MSDSGTRESTVEAEPGIASGLPARDAIRDLKARIGKSVLGQDRLVESMLIGLLANGNLLIESLPGLAKTRAVKTLAKHLAADLSRVQFTPDLLPSDVTGAEIYLQTEKGGQFQFQKGPIFANLVLADEINRAPAKVQSALLEAMEERQVTVAGKTYKMPGLFMVLATENPIEQEGTYPLPEAQLDRFMFKLLVTYPSVQDEAKILHNYAIGHDHRRLDDYGLQTVLTAEHVVAIQRHLVRVIVEEPIIQYITKIVAKTREWPAVEVGASPRASVNLLLGSRALAACRNRHYVVPDDVKQLAPWVLRHRLRLSPEAEIDGTSVETVIQEVLDAVEAPQPSEVAASSL